MTLRTLGQIFIILVDEYTNIFAALNRTTQVESLGIAEDIAHKEHTAVARIGLGRVEEIGRLALRADERIPRQSAVGSVNIPVGYCLKDNINRLHRYAFVIKTVTTSADEYGGCRDNTGSRCKQKLMQSGRKVSRTGRRLSEV